jgi:hypothetical protein
MVSKCFDGGAARSAAGADTIPGGKPFSPSGLQPGASQAAGVVAPNCTIRHSRLPPSNRRGLFRLARTIGSQM